QGVSWDSIFLHEAVKGIARNSPEARSGNAKPLELTRVKAANDRLLTHFTDLGRLACRENRLHRCVGPILRDQGRSPPSPSQWGHDRRSKTSPDRPPCKPISRPEPNRRMTTGQLRRSNQTHLRAVLKSTKPSDITNITKLSNCRKDPNPVNPNSVAAPSFATSPLLRI